MGPPVSELYRVQDIRDAGRGVIASRNLPVNTLVLENTAPAFHVIFRQYRKEVCAQCFHYNRGRTLAIRNNDVGKVFCTVNCQSQWGDDVGEIGVRAWRAVEGLAKTRKCQDIHERAGVKPGADTITLAWQETKVKADVLNEFRKDAATKSAAPSKAMKKRAQAIQDDCSKNVDPDILSYFTSGLLFLHQSKASWQQDVLSLAMADEPYDDTDQLLAHCTSYLQLTSVIPYELLPSLTPDLCLTMVRADNHNAFGLRSGSEDNEEYMGYAVYPAASYFNHSCSPNLGKKRVGRGWEFQTLRNIPAGEECSITYLGGDERDMAVDERRTRLKKQWGFECQCERCREELCIRTQ